MVVSSTPTQTWCGGGKDEKEPRRHQSCKLDLPAPSLGSQRLLLPPPLSQNVVPAVGALLFIIMAASPTRAVWRTRRRSDIGGKLLSPLAGLLGLLQLLTLRAACLPAATAPCKSINAHPCGCAAMWPARELCPPMLLPSLQTPAEFNPLPTVVLVCNAVSS